MRTPVAGIASVVILTTSTVLAQGLSAPPTRVCQLGDYACPTHAEIQATWPARCPICDAVLHQVPPPAFTLAGFAPLFDMDSRRRDDEARERAARRRVQRASPPLRLRLWPLSTICLCLPAAGLLLRPQPRLLLQPQSGLLLLPEQRLLL